MTSAQEAIQEARPKASIPVHSPVGESECNGRAENVIRRMQEQTRALRHQVEHGMGRKISDDSTILVWMAIGSAELLPKCSGGDVGTSFYERIRSEKCMTPLIPFGEVALYLPYKHVHRSKGERTTFPGV